MPTWKLLSVGVAALCITVIIVWFGLEHINSITVTSKSMQILDCQGRFCTKTVMTAERKKHTSGEQRSSIKNDTCLGSPCTKTIMFAERLKNAFRDNPFSTCDYSNCQFKFSDSHSDLVKSSLAFVEFNSPLINQITIVNFLPNQLILVFAHEPPAYKHDRWKKKNKQL